MADLIEALSRIASRCAYETGECVFREGEEASAIFRVVRGEVHLYRHSPDGKRILLHRAVDGGFFAEASLNASNYHCTAVCEMDSTVESLDATQVRDILQNDPDSAMQWIELLSRELRGQRASVERLHLNGTADRLRHFLITEGRPSGRWARQGSLTHLAETLGVSRESLYRTLSTLEEHGRIVRSDAEIRLIG